MFVRSDLHCNVLAKDESAVAEAQVRSNFSSMQKSVYEGVCARVCIVLGLFYCGHVRHRTNRGTLELLQRT